MQAQPWNTSCICTTLKMFGCHCCGRNHALHSQERSSNVFYSLKAVSFKNSMVDAMVA